MHMPQGSQQLVGESLASGFPLGVAVVGRADTVSGPHPLIFGSWMPEDFSKMASERSSLSAQRAGLDESTMCAYPADGQAPCNSSGQFDGTDDSAACLDSNPQHVPISAPVMNALHLLVNGHYQQLVQHQLIPPPPSGQQLFIIPTALPFFAQPLMQFLSAVPGMVAPSAAGGTPTWLSSAPPSYPNAAYNGGAGGFWLHGYYWSSSEHYVAYRRGVIAYNYHYFGIRPHFRPPPDLPRPRPPVAKPAGVAHSSGAVIGSTASSPAGGSDSIPLANRVTKPFEDNESPCCSPGSSSTCSNGDSDDAGSDVCHPDPDTDLSCEPHQVAPLNSPGSTCCLPGGPANITGRGDSARHALDARPVLGCAEGCIPTAASRGWSGAGSLTCSASVRALGGTELRTTSGSCCAAAAMQQHPLPSMRCSTLTNIFSRVADDCMEDARPANGHAVATVNPIPGVCPRWLERQFCALLDRVVTDALVGPSEEGIGKVADFERPGRSQGVPAASMQAAQQRGDASCA